MYFFDYLLIGLTLALFPLVKVVTLCSRKNFAEINPEVDLFGLFATEFLNDLDSRFWSRWLIPSSLLLVSFLVYPWIQWEVLDSTLLLRNFVFFLSCVVTWKAVTEDIDLATGQKLLKERLLLMLFLAGTFFYPGFLFPLFFTGIVCLRGWYHHQVMIWRILQVFLAYLFAVVVLKVVYLILDIPLNSLVISTPLFLFFCMVSSHYFGSGLRKMRLGKSWYSWAWNNHLHYLAASAYMWGWQRSLSEEKAKKIILILKKMEPLLQFGVLVFECGWLFSGFDFTFTFLLCSFGIIFHLLVFLSSGIFFWQSICVFCALLSVLLAIPAAIASELFNWQNGFLLSAILLIFPLRNKLWSTNDLAWWDTPYIGRVHWEVVGESGKEYGLYNNFLSPHERLFGRYYFIFLITEKNFHQHLGEVIDFDLRNAIVASKGDKSLLTLCKERWGKYRGNQILDNIHDLYMIQFFENFNKGACKYICPSFIKAPGGQFFYQGRKPSFKGQEKVMKVNVIYREEFFDGCDFKIIKEEKLKELDIPNDS